MIYSFVVSFILGIVFEKVFGLGWTVGALVFLISSIFFIFSFRSQEQPLGIVPEGLSLNISRLFLIIGLAFCLGTLRMAIVDVFPDPNLLKHVGQKIYFEAVVSEEPDIRETSTRYIVMPYFSSEYVSECTDIFLLENSCVAQPQSGSQGIQKHIPSKSKVLLIADHYPKLEYGDKIRVSGKLELPKNFKNENGNEFDYISYLSKDKIHFLMYRPEVEKIGSGESNKIIAPLYSFKNVFIENISRVVPEPNSSLLGGLIFGVKQSLGTKLLDDFRKVGLIHIVVLSGYNITIIAI